MDNPLVISALNKYSDIYDKIQLIPIRWNKKSRRFLIVSSHKQLISWYCCMTVELLTGIICFYIFGQRIFSKQYHIPWFTAFITAFVGFMDVLGKCKKYRIDLHTINYHKLQWLQGCFIGAMADWTTLGQRFVFKIKCPAISINVIT